MRTFAAPGKLMIAGEYSVLGPGGVALAVAVDPGIEAVVAPAETWTLARAEGGVAWQAGDETVPGALAFARAALEAALEHAGQLPPHRIETRLPGGTATGARKPGVGGSASASVVVAGAVLGLAGSDPTTCRMDVTRIALQAHRGLQGGGSGYDVATVAHGGLVCWWREAERAESLAWPAGLGFLAGYSGKSARTRRQLEKLTALTRRYPDSGAAELAALNREALALVEAFRSGGQAVLDGVSNAHRALERWDRRRGLGIVTPAIDEMVRLAADAGAAAKVSGAGAGDSVIALGDEDRLLAVASGWQAAGFSPLTVVPADAGVREL